MNDYEFWNELGKIFNAVVSYQEKAVEFNKRFINPWIRLGNVFDKQDRNEEAICAYEKALELDPANAQNWYELGNIHFREKNYDKAVEAYNKAIEFGPESGWSYNNLALTLVSQGKYAEALPLYQKGVGLIEDDKEKAVVWNRIGNVYRKLNQYDLAVQSFQQADELDADNAGFRDELDDVAESTAPPQSDLEQDQKQESAADLNPIQLILSESQAEAETSEETNPLIDSVALSEVAVIEPPSSEDTTPAVSDVAIANNETIEDEGKLPNAEQPDSDHATENALPSDRVDQELADTGQTTTVIIQETSETYTGIPETVAVTTTDTTTEVIVATEQADDETAIQTEEIVSVSDVQTTDVIADQASTLNVEEIDIKTSDEDVTDLVVSQPEVEKSAVESESTVAEEKVETENKAESNIPNAAEQSAYEEYLKDNNELVVSTDEEQQDSMPEALQEPASFVDSSGELQIEMDTKNAHVWNELGNIYFNTGAYDDAVVAYSKAIQLDRCFAWPYSNLALTYVQKGRFTEAILLYQRSIELFASEKDKAISWNRLGNVYRRLNSYENAISAYQRADELDPENTTLSLQSRFSLLGNYSTDQVPSQVSQAEEVS
jgi:tetratricopeptide (TPR) repeat protein